MSQEAIRVGSTLESARRLGLAKAYYIPEAAALNQIEMTSFNFENQALYHCVLTQCNLRKCYLFHCLVVESNIDDSTAEHCTIVDQILDDGQALEEKLLMGTLPVRYSKVRGCFLVDTIIRGGKVSGSNICRGQLSYCEVQTSFFNKCVQIYYSYLNTCKMDTAGHLYHSTILDTETDNSAQNDSEVITTPLHLRHVPAEVRLLIFREVFDVAGPALKSPPLLQAVRGDPKLYGEALEVFYKLSTFRLSAHNSESRKAMPQNAIMNIQSLNILLPFRTLDLPTFYSSTTQIRKLTMDFTSLPTLPSHSSRNTFAAIMHIGSIWLPKLNTIQEFSAVFKILPHGPYTELEQRPSGITTFSQGVGKLPISCCKQGTGKMTYTWTAEEGQVLGWTWNEANKWVEWLRIWEEDEVVDVEDVEDW